MSIGHEKPPEPLPQTLPEGTYVRGSHGPLAAYRELRLMKRREAPFFRYGDHDGDALVYACGHGMSDTLVVSPDRIIWETLTPEGKACVAGISRAFGDLSAHGGRWPT